LEGEQAAPALGGRQEQAARKDQISEHPAAHTQQSYGPTERQVKRPLTCYRLPNLLRGLSGAITSYEPEVRRVRSGATRLRLLIEEPFGRPRCVSQAAHTRLKNRRPPTCQTGATDDHRPLEPGP
jgi:hypothetical protein